MSEKLHRGLKKFSQDVLPHHRDRFKELESSQAPQALFISCNDSRVDPNLLTHSPPGDLFILRNVANMVPPSERALEFPSSVSSLEYAVKVLKVEQIILCGHSNCGGCAAMETMARTPEDLVELPVTQHWLQLGPDMKDAPQWLMKEQDSAKRRELMNLVHQLGHIRSYPWIREAEQNGDLEILVWHYTIHTGQVLQYREGEGFQPIL